MYPKSPLAKVYQKPSKIHQKTPHGGFLLHFGGCAGGFFFVTFWGFFWYLAGFLVHFGWFFGTIWRFFLYLAGFFGYILWGFWYILGGVLVHFAVFYGTFLVGFGTIRGFLCLGTVYGTIQGVSSTHMGFFSTFCLISFWDFVLIGVVGCGSPGRVLGASTELLAPQKNHMPRSSFACSACGWSIQADVRHGGRRGNGRSWN